MSDSLYHLSTELQAIHAEIIEQGGEITPEIEAKLDALALPFKEKVGGMARWMKNIEGRETAIESEIARLTALKKAASNHRERLKEYILSSMLRADKEKVELDLFTISAVKNPPSCIIENEKSIPARFITIIPETKQVDKKGVLDALKKGEKVDGARLGEDKYHLRVR